MRRALAGCECSGEVREALARTGEWDEVWSADVLPSEKLPDVLMVPGQETEFNGRTHPESRVLTGHYQGDVRDLFDWDHPVNAERKALRDAGNPDLPLWDLFIGFPPCTHLSLAGAAWWKVKRLPRYDEDGNELPSLQDEGAAFFMEMVRAPARYVAVENPRGDMTRRYRPPDQYVQPHEFGDPLIKLTGLWLEGLPLLIADCPVEPAGRVASGGGSCRTDVAAGRGMQFVNGHEDRHGRVHRQRERNRTLPGIARAMAEQWTAFIAEQERAAA